MERLKSYLKDTGALFFAALLIAVAFVFAKARLLKALFSREVSAPPAPPSAPPVSLPAASEGTQEEVQQVETESAAERATATTTAEGKVEALTDIAAVTDGATRRSLLARLLQKF